MTRLDWDRASRPGPAFPGRRAASAAADAVIEQDRARRRREKARENLSGEDAQVYAAMPGTAREISDRTGLTTDRVGGALSRLKRTGLIRKTSQKQWKAVRTKEHARPSRT